MEAGLREVCRSVRIGKILIQRVSTPLFTPYQDLRPSGQLLTKCFTCGSRTKRLLFRNCSMRRFDIHLVDYGLPTGLNGSVTSFRKISLHDMCCSSTPCSVCSFPDYVCGVLS